MDGMAYLFRLIGSQIMDGVKESTGLDLTALLAGMVGGKAAVSTQSSAGSDAAAPDEQAE